MKIENGILTISLDFELYWGIRDKRSIEDYKKNLKGVNNAIDRILKLFDKYGVHATWATVGFLFASDMEELKKYYPNKKSGYLNTNLNPYLYINTTQILKRYCHFAPNLIGQITNQDNQEIGTHTFSHYYCLENDQTVDEFSCDIQSAIKISNSKDISIKSLVFPRNQWNSDYLKVLQDYGIECYRGNENGWLYKAVDETKEKKSRRAIRLLDAYLNLSGSNTHDIETMANTKPYNIPSRT